MRNKREVKGFNAIKKLEVNENIDIEVLYGKYEGKYHSQVVDILNEEVFIINTPFLQGGAINLAIGTKINIIFSKKTGLYSLPVKVVSREKDVTPLLKVEIIGSVIKIQEREFFRLELFKETKYIVNNDNDVDSIDEEDKKSVYNCIIEDISAGGLKLLTRNQNLVEGDIIEIKFDFANLSFKTIIAEVARVTNITKDNEVRYNIGVEFVDFYKQDKDELIGWLFDKQRELRKKGLI